jgi:hypothetical protein
VSTFTIPRPHSHERLIPGTDTEMVYRRAAAIILSAPTPELPDSGNGVATVSDLERALAPLIGMSTQRNADRVRHCLALLSSDKLLTIDLDCYWVGVPA